jgi:hypothetical protein
VRRAAEQRGAQAKSDDGYAALHAHCQSSIGNLKIDWPISTWTNPIVKLKIED